ncbi:MAG: ABC transporter permease [Eubacteriales bacterium]
MKAFLVELGIQFRIDFREKGVLLTFYIVPLLFFVVMGYVFATINPEAKVTLAASMAIFASTMGAILGIPGPLVKMKESGVLRAYRVSGIPGWSILLVQGISSFLHLLIVSIIILITAPLLFGAQIPVNLFGYALVLAVLLFANISLGLFIGTISKSQSAATMLGQIIFLPSLMLGGIMFPASMLPGPLRLAGKAFPATNAMQSFIQLAYGMDGNSDPYQAVCIILLIGSAAIGITAWKFFSNTKY